MRFITNKLTAAQRLIMAIAIVAFFAVGGWMAVKVSAPGGFTFDTPRGAGGQLYVDPNGTAAQQAALWRDSDPTKAQLMDKLAQQPVAYWVTAPEQMPDFAAHIQDVQKANKTDVIVSYYFPKRDCGRHSTGGAPTPEAYKSYVTNLASTIGTTKAIIILEPDALSLIDTHDDQGQPCLSQHEKDLYYELMSHTVEELKALPNTRVYMDAGNSAWVKNHSEVAARLQRANIKAADGFSLNVSNFRPTAETVDYGRQISAEAHNKPFVIDTSRNGLGAFTNPVYPDYNWCNPTGRALGHYPTLTTDQKDVDAYLYIKRPGESDGSDPDYNKCFGGPRAGTWWPDYAVGLIERWPQDLQPK